MATAVLLITGMVTFGVFLAVMLVEGVSRQGYRAAYHTGSELSLGPRGWVQVVNFMLLGVGMLAYAAGIYRALDAVAGAVLLSIFGIGAILSGVFRPDPLRGYPPGSPTGGAGMTTRHGRVHNVCGPIMFFAILGACLTLAPTVEGIWRLYTVSTAILGLALTVWTAVAFQRDAASTGLVQRTLILVYAVWVVLFGIHLV